MGFYSISPSFVPLTFPEMNLVFPYIITFMCVSVFGLPEVTTKGNKLKIIVPNKIRFIHHHHEHPRSTLKDVKLKFRYLYEPQYDDGDVVEPEDEVVNESKIRHIQLAEGSRRGMSFYATPTSRYSNSGATKPVFFYNNYNKFTHPSTVAVVKYGNFDEREGYDDDYYPPKDYGFK